MHAIWIICKREVAAFFDTLTAYIIIVVFLGLSGFFTWLSANNIFFTGQASLQSFFSISYWTLFFFIPTIPMRMLAEEHLNFTNLAFMNSFRFHDTGVCIPDDDDLKGWLEEIDFVEGTGSVCSVILVSPAFQEERVVVTPEFKWNVSSSNGTFQLQIAEDSGFEIENIRYNAEEIDTVAYTLTEPSGYPHTVCHP